MSKGNHRKRRTWFWVGITLIVLSSIFFLPMIAYFISDIVSGGELVNSLAVVLILLFLYSIPMGIGIYCFGRSTPEAVKFAKWANKTRLVISLPWYLIAVLYFMVIGGLACIWLGIHAIGTDPPDLRTATVLWFFASLFILIGAGYTRVRLVIRFDEPHGYITITREIPIWFWFFRKKRVISKEQARTTNSLLFDMPWEQHDVIEYVIHRIREFGQQ